MLKSNKPAELFESNGAYTVEQAKQDTFNLVWKPIRKYFSRNRNIVDLFRPYGAEYEDVINDAFVAVLEVLDNLDNGRKINNSFVIEIARLRTLRKLLALNRKATSKRCQDVHNAISSAVSLSEKTDSGTEIGDFVADDNDAIDSTFSETIEYFVTNSGVAALFVAPVVDYVQGFGDCDEIAARYDLERRLLYIQIAKFRKYMRNRYTYNELKNILF